MELGVFINVMAGMVGVLGKQGIKYYYKWNTGQWLWWVSLFLAFVATPILDVISFSLIKASSIAPLGALTIVWNSIFSPLILDEDFTSHTFVGCLFLVLGCFGVSVFGPPTAQDLSASEYIRFLIEPPALLYYLMWTVTAGCLVYALKRVIPKSNTKERGLCLSLLGGLVGGNVFFVAITVSLAKVIQELSWTTSIYLCISGGMAALVALGGAILLTYALKFADALPTVASWQAASVMTGSVSGMIVLHEYQHCTGLSLLFYGLSLALVVYGLHLFAHDFSRTSIGSQALVSP